MKTYQQLEPEDIIQDGDMFPSINRRMRPIPEEYDGKQADILLVFRPVPAPQWQTGEIPEPDCLAVLTLFVPEDNQLWHFVSYDINGNGYYLWHMTIVDDIHHMDITERWPSRKWLITPITLPAPTVSGDTEQ